MDLSSIQIGFNLGDQENLRPELERNIKTILSTPVGTCPLYRDFGLDVSMLDSLTPAASNMLTVAIIDAIETWEPRVRVTDASVRMDGNEHLEAKVVVTLG